MGIFLDCSPFEYDVILLSWNPRVRESTWKRIESECLIYCIDGIGQVLLILSGQTM